MGSTGRSAHAAQAWRKASRSATSPAACVELGSAVMDQDRTLWMLEPGTGSRGREPIGRLTPSGRFQPSTARSAPSTPPAPDPAHEPTPLSRAYARARAEFRLPPTYRFTPSHAEALERLTVLAPRGSAAGGRAGGADRPAFARLVNLDWSRNWFSGTWSAVVKDGDLPKLLSVARLTRDVYGRDFALEQLQAVRRLADAVRADAATNVLSRVGRAPGDEVRLDDLIAVVRTFGGIEPGAELTREDAVTLADLVPGVVSAGPVTVEALKRTWRAAAEALRDDAAVVLNQAMPAVAELGPALAVLGPHADGHRAEVERRVGELTRIVAGSWRPNQADRVEAARAALALLQARIDGIHAAAVKSLHAGIDARLAAPAGAARGRSEELAALRAQVAAVEPADGAAAVNELLEIRAELDSLETPPVRTPPVQQTASPVRRLPGRVLFEAARNEHRGNGEPAHPIPWGEWGRVARVGGVWLGADRAVAEQAAALVPEAVRPAVTDGLMAEFGRLGSVEAGRRLASPQGLRVPTARGPATVRLVLGPLTGEHGAIYRRPEEVQSVQLGARPSQALDLPQIMTPSTFTDVSDGRSIAPETAGDGLISIATGRTWMPSIGVLPTLTGRGSRTHGSYEGAVTAMVQQIWHDRYAYFDVAAGREDLAAGSHWSVTFTDEHGAEQTGAARVDVLLAFAEDESPPDQAMLPGTPVELPAAPDQEMAQAFHSVLHRVTTIVESLVPAGGPQAAADAITPRFTGTDASFQASVQDLFTESMLFTVNQHILGHGYPSGEFRVNRGGEDWAAFRLRGRMTSLRHVDVTHGYVQQDARHLFWSGESSGMSGGVSSALQLAPTFPGFKVQGTPITIGPVFSAGAGGSVNRSLAASMGAGDWRYLGYPSGRRVYRLTIDLLVDVRSSQPAATGLVPLALTGYVEVPEREADRFERELRAVLDGLDLDATDDEGRPAPPADGPHLTDRTPPPGILLGRSRGPSVLDMLGGFEHVIPTAMNQIDSAFGDSRLATLATPLTPRQRHRLERALTQRFSKVAALPYTSQLISHRMSFTRLYQAIGGRLRLTVRVRSEQGRAWTGSRLEWARIDHYPISYSDLGASEEVVAQTSHRGGGHIKIGPLRIRLRSVNLPGQYTYTRSRSNMLTTRAGVWSSLGFVYEGPVRLFTFGTRYDVEVALSFEPEAASGGIVTATAAGAVRRLFGQQPSEPVARTIRRHDAVAGLMRYVVAEGLSPLAGGETVPRSPRSPGELGRAVVRRRPGSGPAAPPQWSGARGAPETLRPDDQPLEVLGLADLWHIAAELLEEAGVAERTYADTLDVTLNEDQLIGRMMWGGPVAQASGVVHGGTVGNRHAVLSLQGRMYDLRRQAGGVRMRETDIMDSEPAVVFTGRRSTSHALSAGADLAGTMEDGGPSGGWTFRNVAEADIHSNEVLSGRWITQENRDYRPYRGTMLWDITVTSWSANAAGTWSVRQDTAQVLVTGGVMALRPAPQPPAERPPGVPATLRLDTIPLISTSDRLEWPGLQHAPDGLNPVLNMVRGVLGVVDARLLHQQWTIAGGRPAVAHTGLPTSLHTILEHNALLGHRDTLLGPGLVLHLARSLPGWNEQVSLVLRAEPVDGRDYTYDDTRARDFALYRLGTQRRVRRRGTTSAHTAGGNTGTTRIPLVSDQVQGGYLEGAVESDFYEQATNAHGEIFRTRDVLGIIGDAHAYTGRLRITATVYRGYNPSKALQAVTFGLANPGFAMLLDPNTPVPIAVTNHVEVDERVQIPAAMLRTPPPDLAPATQRVRPVVPAATPEEVLTNAGHTLFPVERDLILSRGVVPGGIDPLALRALFDHSIAIFNGTAPGTTTPAAVMDLMAATGVPFEAYAALLSRHQVLSGLHLSLGDGTVFPPFVREDGPATDARGELSAQVRFYDPQPLGWVDARLTSESLHMDENDLLDSAGSTFGLSADGGPALAPENTNPLVPVEPSAYLGQSHDHGGTAGERLVRPVAFRRRTHYLRVRTGVLAGLAISAANQRRDIRYGAGQTRLWYTLDDSLEVLLDPETALAMRMLHGSTGIPTPHGRYLPNVPATAPAPGTREATEELSRLRAAFALPRYGDWYPIAGHYDPDTSSVTQTSVRYDPRTRRTETVTGHLGAADFAQVLDTFEDLGDRPIVLVMGGVDAAFASELARSTSHDLLFTTDDVHQDTAVRASRNGQPGQWRYLPARGGTSIVHSADLGQVLTGEITPALRGTRADDPPGTMNPDSVISWTTTPPARTAPAPREDELTTGPEPTFAYPPRPARRVIPAARFSSRPGSSEPDGHLRTDPEPPVTSGLRKTRWKESSYSDGTACVQVALQHGESPPGRGGGRPGPAQRCSPVRRCDADAGPPRRSTARSG